MRIRKALPVLVMLIVFTSVCIASCTGAGSGQTIEEAPGGVSLRVSTMYAGYDSNSDKYHNYVKQWEKETGNSIEDISTTADDSYKTRVIMEFQSGAEPDVLFFFNGVDADSLVANRRVVSVDEVREVYPEYASNMKEGMMTASNVDGRIYCIPMNGYWEGLFVNRKICEEAGVEIPGADTDWATFLEDCGKIKEAGYVPIAASLAEIPHYWFEFCIYNHQSPDEHLDVPKGTKDPAGIAWTAGLNDIAELYRCGYFPNNTLSVSDEECFKMFVNGKAAFLLDGSWRIAAIDANLDNPDDYCVAFVPGNKERAATDIIGGLSTGYYITRKAWEDPDKRDAAVSFVEYMTSDIAVSDFAQVTATALKNGVTADTSQLSSFMQTALDMAENATTVCEAVQDRVPTNCRAPIFDNMAAIVTGRTDSEDAVQSVIDLLAKEK